jgi:hypothetical protein
MPEKAGRNFILRLDFRPKNNSKKNLLFRTHMMIFYHRIPENTVYYVILHESVMASFLKSIGCLNKPIRLEK